VIEILIIFGVGLTAGTLGGILGIGGGIIIMPFLRFGLGLSPAYAAGVCILAVFFTTLGGSYRHYRLDHIDVRSLLPVIIAGAFSTILFSIIFTQLSKREIWIDLGVGLVFLLVSTRMIFEGLWKPISQDLPSNIQNSRIPDGILKKASIGGLAGIFPGLLGIGTGALLVPAFTFLFSAPIKVAMGSSLACFAFNAFWSSLLKAFQGFIDFETALPICLGTVIGSNFGAILNRHFPSRALKILFGVVFIYISLKFIMNFFTT
jgi:uncharacterized membrane protein YfcA